MLARKYRPAGFDALIGQDVMVRTLGNAIRQERLAHAWLMTGVRGVGKTSTARLIAKALNCSNGPTIEPCGACEHCMAIGEGRHIDVVEMDAASHTSVDDVREIIEAVRYASVSARFKVYIIDEVHMLSKNAFNALLKTLEEPPAHVKFIFATTEVAKVPITVLSRCQRFDLKRVQVETLRAHFARIAELEGVAAEPEALAMIARAAEGSVRDGLSILDQAIAHAVDGVTATQVREMLGLADRGGTRALLGLLLAGDAAAVLRHLDVVHERGAEPQAVLHDLLDMVHALTRTRVAGGVDPLWPEDDRAALTGWAGQVGFAALHRLWQLLLKGLQEVNAAPLPAQALEMALLRVVHAAGLPDPAEVLKRGAGEGEVIPPVAARAPAGGPNPMFAAVEARAKAVPADYAALVALVAEVREPLLAKLLHDDVGCLDYRPPHLLLARQGPLPATFAADLAKLLRRETGTEWRVGFGEGAALSLRAREEATREALMAAAAADPRYLALRAHFGGAELLGVDGQDDRSAA